MSVHPPTSATSARGARDVERCLHVASRRMAAPCPSKSVRRGFTLVELMAVVAIVSIIAVVGLAALRNRVFGSKSTEALAMVQSIRVAEERWKSENLQYLNASPNGNWFPADPRLDSPAKKRDFYGALSHPDVSLWNSLRPVAVGPVEFGYLANAGPPTVQMTAPSFPSVTFPPPCSGTTIPPACNGDHWYVIQAIADLDHDGIPAFFVASNLTGEIMRVNEGE